MNEMRGGPSRSRWILLVCMALGLSSLACDGTDNDTSEDLQDPRLVVQQVESVVWAFHAADTARNAEGVIDLLWPEFTMLVDGRRLTYPEVVEGSREFMATLESFHTEWSDLEIVPVGNDAAVSSFVFRDSIVTRAGEVDRAHGPTTFVWQKRAGEWRVLFTDADHYRDGP